MPLYLPTTGEPAGGGLVVGLCCDRHGGITGHLKVRRIDNRGCRVRGAATWDADWSVIVDDETGATRDPALQSGRTS